LTWNLRIPCRWLAEPASKAHAKRLTRSVDFHWKVFSYVKRRSHDDTCQQLTQADDATRTNRTIHGLEEPDLDRQVRNPQHRRPGATKTPA
jgi:hypothetical protein